MSMFRYRDQEAKNIAKATAEVRKRAKVDTSLARRKVGRSLAADIESLQADIAALADRVTSLEALVASLAESAAP